MKILVFGKDGQLGKAFKNLFDAFPPSQNIEVQYAGRDDCDLSNEKALNSYLEQVAPNLIINAAAYTAVDLAQTNEELAFAINTHAPELMAAYATSHGASLLHYSTDYVFDGQKQVAYIESDPRNPLSVYGKSKAAGEEAIEKVFAKQSASRYAILRTSWVYGEGANFIRTILRLAKERDQLRVIHDQLGVPTNAQWLAQTSLDLVFDDQFQLKPFPSGIYHAVPNGETSWHGMASLAVKVATDCGVDLTVKPDSILPILAAEYPLPAPRPQNSRLDNSKLRLLIESEGDMTKLQHLNTSWEESVRTYIAQLAQKNLI
ncbi:dTDP-4-dehydrorhamnose reductase [Polynucleobacter tropicus]|uniref:dTDP-4-dehydrorhamnose reductase n=1 Tax=Polynucleobacter tropicus TaxID=1743174 RepID=A0A6M9PZ07_9BURK|nr:dTDP-4-dehydrorhamnose reductase [Polynucleobacter tropicus]QKM63985.1 dTDP-4-dehydrorhamnose reductase [Polynucleobacter tropicus]